MAFEILNEADSVLYVLAGVNRYPQAEPDKVDFDIVVQGINEEGVVSGGVTTPQGVPDMTVAVAAAVVRIAGTDIAYAGGNVNCGAAAVGFPRFDLISIDNAGAAAVVNGVAAAIPVFPAVPANRVIVAAVWRAANDNTITAADIVDKRCLLLGATFGTVPTLIGIVGGIATPNRFHHTLSAQAGAADDLDGMTFATIVGNGEPLIIRPDAGDTITIKHNALGGADARNILCIGNADIVLDDDHDFAICIYSSAIGAGSWMALGGGGGGGAPHNLLDGATHPDTVAQAVSVGSLVYGDNTPDWNELVRVVPGGPALRNVLGFDQGDTISAWKVSLDAVNPANIAAAAVPGTSLVYSHRDHVHAHPAALGVNLHHNQLHAAADHNAAVLPAGFNENLGAFYLDIGEIVVPANPGANIRRLFTDNATGELSVRTNAGATVSLEGGGGGLALANKGELHGYGVADAIVAAAGADNQVLQSDAADAEGLTWRAIPQLAGVADTGGVTRIALAGASPHVVVTGDAQITGVLGVNSGVVATQMITVSPVTAGVVSWAGIAIIPSLTFTVAAGIAWGILGTANVTGPVGSAGHSVYGLNFIARAVPGGAGVGFATLVGCQARIGIIVISTRSLTITDVKGGEFGVMMNTLFGSALSTWTNYYGVDIPAIALSSARLTITTTYGLHVGDRTGTSFNTVYLIEAGPATPYFRVVGGGNPPNAGLATEGDSNMYLLWTENGAQNFRQVRWRAQASLGAGDRVLIAV